MNRIYLLHVLCISFSVLWDVFHDFWSFWFNFCLNEKKNPVIVCWWNLLKVGKIKGRNTVTMFVSTLLLNSIWEIKENMLIHCLWCLFRPVLFITILHSKCCNKRWRFYPLLLLYTSGVMMKHLSREKKDICLILPYFLLERLSEDLMAYDMYLDNVFNGNILCHEICQTDLGCPFSSSAAWFNI